MMSGMRDHWVSIGETMVAFVSRHGSRDYEPVVAGAESNVAMGMARLGLPSRWVSRLGDDPLGELIADVVSTAGVDVDVVLDPARPTGIMTKHIEQAVTRGQYYRVGSAASALSIDDLARIGTADRVHVTGITPALSSSAADLVAAVVTSEAWYVSFDVNYRPALWPGPETAAEVLLGLARQADLVFIGEDEANALFGTGDPGQLLELIVQRDGQELVVKRGAEGASALTHSENVWVPGLAADDVDETGAGDAFAAGYLAGHRLGWDTTARLRLGHWMGSRVVGVIQDVPPDLSTEELDALSPESLARHWG